MPRIAHTVETQKVLSRKEEMLLTVFLREINLVRQAVGQPPRTAQDLRLAIRDYLRGQRPTRTGSH